MSGPPAFSPIRFVVVSRPCSVFGIDPVPSKVERKSLWRLLAFLVIAFSFCDYTVQTGLSILRGGGVSQSVPLFVHR